MLITSAYPYGREKRREQKFTDSDGAAKFSSVREWRTEMLAIHGSESFFWNWCISRDGHITFSTDHRNAKTFETNLIVRLGTGTSTPCPQQFIP